MSAEFALTADMALVGHPRSVSAAASASQTWRCSGISGKSLNQRWIVLPNTSGVMSASVFSVRSFPTEIGAQRAVHPLARTDGEKLRIADAAVVSWPGDRERPVAWQASDLAGERAKGHV